MPRFFFNVHDGIDLLDEDGTEFPNWEEARLAAIRAAGEIFKDNARRLSLGEQWRMEVTDEEGYVLLHMDFSMMEPSVRPNLEARARPDAPSA